MVSVAHMSAGGSSRASTFKRVWTICHWYPVMIQGRGSVWQPGSVYLGTSHEAHRCQGGWHASRLGTGEPHVTCQETHSKASNLPTGPPDGPAAHMAASLRPHGSHPIRVAAWHLELLFGGPGRVETPRPGLEKLGAVRTDRDLIGLLFTLI